jgi:signal transduction histidine kinase
MMSDVTATPATSREEFGAMWRRQQPYWHAVFAIVWAAAVVVTLIDEPGPRGRGPSLALLGVIALAYAVLGTRAMTSRGLRWAVAYQVVAWSALLGIQWVDSGTQAWLLYFALFPQLWAMLPTRWAMAGTVVVVTAFSLVRWAQLGFSGESLTEILISSVISMGLSLSLGLFINRLVGEAESRAETIDELRATQARLAAAERDRGVHEERERISREIHDTLAQGFTSVVALSRAAQAALVRGDTAAAGERLALIEHTASDNLDEARLIVAELTPGHLQSRTLGEALERLGAAVSSESGLHAQVRVAGDPVPLGGSAEVVILRTAQEALSNVRRHASAARVDLTLAYDDPDEVVLTVCDDGLGFDLDGARAGFGLDGVQARAAEVGGAVEVLSGPGAGTTLRLVVPR